MYLGDIYPGPGAQTRMLLALPSEARGRRLRRLLLKVDSRVPKNENAHWVARLGVLSQVGEFTARVQWSLRSGIYPPTLASFTPPVRVSFQAGEIVALQLQPTSQPAALSGLEALVEFYDA